MSEVRVRFAPSPTGGLHIGGVRTALYNYLYAKQNGGKFILRIEDTDQKRFVEGAEEYIVEALEWFGLKADESPVVGGPFGPYKQSERKEIYQKYAQQLLEEGKAYYAFDTAEELDEMREKLKEARVANQQYNEATRASMKNSLTLPEEEVKRRIESGEPYVVRLKVPAKEEIRLHDLVRGWVHVHASTLDDKVILKSDGLPTYHLANVVDDHLMKITHVIRGEEWLPSAPTHYLLYKFLGWENEMPEFAHIPLILKPDGNGKLSKRAAEKMGIPIFPLNWHDSNTGITGEGFKESGYLPDALLNFLSLLGWNPGNDEEMFDLDGLIKAFSIEKIGKSGARFDVEKAKWFNQQYLKEKSNSELLSILKQEGELSISDEIAGKALGLMKERITFPKDLLTDADYLFGRPSDYDQKTVKKKWTAEAVDVIDAYGKMLAQLETVNSIEAKEILENVLEAKGVVIGRVMQALRVSITGKGGGPDLMEIIEILGSKETSERISVALEALADRVKQPQTE